MLAGNRRRRTDEHRCCGRRHSPRCRRWRVQRRPAWTASDTSGVRPMATTTMSAATVAASCKVMRSAPGAGRRRPLAAGGRSRQCARQAQVHAGVAGAFGQPVRQCLGQHALQQARRASRTVTSAPSARAVDATSRRKPPPMTATRVWGARPRAQRGGVVQRADVMHAGRAARQAGQFARPPAGRQQQRLGRSRPSASRAMRRPASMRTTWRRSAA